MLRALKESVFKAEMDNVLVEAVIEGTTDNIKDAFLEDPDAVVIGAENDPEIDKLVKDLPEYGEVGAKDIEDLKKLEESLIPAEV